MTRYLERVLRAHVILTVLFAHDLIDGAPPACFPRWLEEFPESGHGLPEDTASFHASNG